MKSQRFIGKFSLSGGIVQISDPDLINQIFRVFRLGIGDSVIICDGNGTEADALIESTGKISDFRITNIRKEERDEFEKILVCSILKKENFELVCQKATELGITKIIPMVSDRTIKLDIRGDRLVKIIREASEQSGRLYLPVLEKPIEFKDAINIEGDLRLFFNMDGESIESLNTKVGNIVGMVGPEGGWTDEEISIAKESGWNIVSLGINTLRGETAGIVASYIIGKSN